MPSTPPTTKALIAANVFVFVLQAIVGPGLIALLGLWPIHGGFMPWQLLSYGFLHGGLTHLLFNLFGIWMFGGELERVWGSSRLLSYFITCVFGAAVAQLLVAAYTGNPYPTLGASGGLFGLLLGFAAVFPRRIVTPLIPPIPMPAWLFVTLYGLLELVLGVTGSATGIAHFAHLGGLAAGLLTLRFWRGQFPFRKGGGR